MNLKNDILFLINTQKDHIGRQRSYVYVHNNNPPHSGGISFLIVLRYSYDLWLYTQYAALFKKTATAKIIKEA